MRKIAFIFPGQGSQAVGMGVAVAERFSEARKVFDRAAEALGWDLLEACRSGPEERLRKTEVAQPALYTAGFASCAALRALGLEPEVVAGHSVGEYAALAAAGVFEFEEGLALVRERGRLMQEAAARQPGAMAAILGLSEAAVAAVCAEAAAAGVCVPVNFNSREQIVIAGAEEAVRRASLLAKASGAKRAISLNVSGAFHSPLMAAAAESMRGILTQSPFRDARIPVAMNVDGQRRQEASQIREALVRQLASAVRWTACVESLQRSGCGIFVECGPGRVLGGLLRRMDPSLEVYATDTADDFGAAAHALAAAGKDRA